MQNMDGQGTRILLKSSTMSASNGWTDKMNMLGQLNRSPGKSQVNRNTHHRYQEYPRVYGKARQRGVPGHAQASNSNMGSPSPSSRVAANPGADMLTTNEDVTAKSDSTKNLAMTFSDVDPDVRRTEVVEGIRKNDADSSVVSNGDVCQADFSLDAAFSSPIVAGELSVSGCIDSTTPDVTSQSLFCTPTSEMMSESDLIIVPGTERKPVIANGRLEKELASSTTEIRRHDETMDTEDEEILFGTPSFTGCGLKFVKEESTEEDTSTSDNDKKDETGFKTDSTFMVSSEPMKVPRNLQNHAKVKQPDSQSSGASDIPSGSDMNITFDVDRATPANPNVLNSTYNAGLVAEKLVALKEVPPMEEETVSKDDGAASVPTTPTTEDDPIKEVVKCRARKGKKQYDIPINKNSTPALPMEIVNSSDSEFEAEPAPQTEKKKKQKAPNQKRDTRADIEALYETENPIQSTSAALVRHEKRVAKQIQEGILVDKKVSSRNERMAARKRNISPVTQSKARRKQITEEAKSTPESRSIVDSQQQSPEADSRSEDAKNAEILKGMAIANENKGGAVTAKHKPEELVMLQNAKKVSKGRGRPRKQTISNETKDIVVPRNQSDEPAPETSEVIEDAVSATSEMDETIKPGITAADGASIPVTTKDEEHSHSEGTKPEAENEYEEKKPEIIKVREVLNVPASEAAKMQEEVDLEEIHEEEKAPKLTPPSMPARGNKRTNNTRKKPPLLTKEVEQTADLVSHENEERLEEVNHTFNIREDGKPNRKRPAETTAKNTKPRKKKAEEEPEVGPVNTSTSRNKRARKNSTLPVEVPKSPQRSRGRSKRAVPAIQEESDTSQELRRSKRMRKCK